jgi:hypothetical protein
MISGLMLYGTTSFLNADGETSVSNEPVWIPASIVEANISDGSWQAGHLNQVSVIPPVSAWPPEWRHLKE